MSDLITALRAKLDEVEQAALNATPGPWSWAHRAGPHRYALVSNAHPSQVVLPTSAPDVYPQRGDAQHIALHSPDAVLAMVAAHRLLLDQFEELTNNRERMFDPALSLQWHLLHQVIETIACGYRIEVTW